MLVVLAGNPNLHADRAARHHEEQLRVGAFADDDLALVEGQRADERLNQLIFRRRQSLEEVDAKQLWIDLAQLGDIVGGPAADDPADAGMQLGEIISDGDESGRWLCLWQANVLRTQSTPGQSHWATRHQP
ncbi:MAG: hypothetical protein ACR2J1_07445 [Methyloceanibacter sp.]|uniref:hypothetical protein n=1 Tax=Methyloceanibacter sp. TaxID=1965321 RepID=UPI003D9BA254